MDLWRVTLPAFIYEGRSLLELYSNLIGHPDLFVKIAAPASPPDRMMAIVRWYTSAVWCGVSGVCVPLPPVKGEVFRCSWTVPGSPDGSAVGVTFAAEQLSIKPPGRG